ncbi:MAG: helix-hairpin-helix domain-containing protein [Armatimonadetes bacterium]|nr:helix-hairpin-helix domain-containing protein [Armatimonadota bacterium]
MLLARGCGGRDTVTVDGDLPDAPSPAEGAVITVHVVGAVRYPGVYQLAAGSRMNDVVAAAGGFAAGADPAAVNLAAPVGDGQQVSVPGRLSGSAYPTQVASVPAAQMDYTPVPPSSGQSVSQYATPPAPGSDSGAYRAAPMVHDAGAPAVASSAPSPSPDADVGQIPPASYSGGAGDSPPAFRGPVSLNTATEKQLEALPGIGPSLAKRIIAYREQNGPFRRIEDLQRVSGVGPKMLMRLRGQVTL